MRKDHFSAYAASYAKFRPRYPQELIESISSHAAARRQALDVGTGNGQVAVSLAEHFETVYGIDISPQQMAQSGKHTNVHYMVSQAESTPFANDSFDLITAGQCYHWFQESEFWQEMKRIAKPRGIVAVWGYQLLRVAPEVDLLIDQLYHEILGNKYWDAERKKIDSEYREIQFPCEEIAFPKTSMSFHWSRDELIGYLYTWSAVQKYIRAMKTDPLAELKSHLKEEMESIDRKYEVHFPIFGKLGRIGK